MQGLLIAGRYRLADSIGSGGMGRVWRAHDEVLHRAVAVKELTAALYVADGDRAVLLARTRAEARAAARINHSAVVTVHDVLEHDGRPWIVMELVEGYSLADAVKEHGRIEPREAARIGLWVLRALRAAHAAGVLHRDVKPGNVLLGRDGRVLLTDFGIAQIEGDSTITRTGEVVGSVDYLAPERIRGQDPGSSSDLWALGATLYTAVEGRSPFRRTSPLSTMQAVVEEEAEPPRYAGALEPVITALLRKEPDRRPGPQETEQMLAEAAEGRRPSTAQAYIPTRGSGLDAPAPYGPAAGPDPGRQGYGAGTGAPGYGAGAGAPGYGAGTGAPGYGTGAVLPGHVSGPAAAGYGTGAAAHGSGAVGHATGAVPGHGPGSAGHPRNGPASVTPTVIGPAPAAGGGGRAAASRRRVRTLALVVAAAVVLGAGAVAGYEQWSARGTDDDGRGTRGTTVSSSPKVSKTPDPTGSASGSGGQGTKGAVPAGWERHDDPQGFSLSLPRGWTRKVYSVQGDLAQIDYTPDGGRHFVRVSIDTSPDFSDAFEHQRDLEQQLGRLVDYQRVTMTRNTYRDREGSLWEYTWTALKKDPPYVAGPRHAVEETYYSREGTEYAIYMSSPAVDWPVASKRFTWVLQSWQPDAG